MLRFLLTKPNVLLALLQMYCRCDCAILSLIELSRLGILTYQHVQDRVECNCMRMDCYFD